MKNRQTKASGRKSRRHELEPEIALLFSQLSNTYDKAGLLTKNLHSHSCARSAEETFEVEILLKNALRILCDAMSHLSS